jgi:hypothetical protein
MTTPSWTLARVETARKEDAQGFSQHAVFVCGNQVVTFLVIGMKAHLGAGPYTFADWTTASGDSDRTWGADERAFRIDGSFCLSVVIDALGAGLRNGTISPVSPNPAKRAAQGLPPK